MNKTNPKGNILKQAIKEVKTHIKSNLDTIAIMYSGGKDSSSVVGVIATIFPKSKLHLLTCNNGGYYPKELQSKTRKSFELLQANVPIKNPVKMVYFDLREPFMNLGIRAMHTDTQKYPTNYICCSCKMLMHMACAQYCKNNNITMIANGFNAMQNYFPDQLPAFLERVEKLIQDTYGVKTLSPLFNTISRTENVNTLLEELQVHPDDFHREKGNAAKCVLEGSYKAPFEKDGKDKHYFKMYKKNVRMYTQEKIAMVKNKKVIKQRRENGVYTKKPYIEQVQECCNKAKIIAEY